MSESSPTQNFVVTAWPWPHRRRPAAAASVFDDTRKFTVLQRHFHKFCDTPNIQLEVAGNVPVMVKSFYNTTNVNAGKFAGSEPMSVVNAGTYSHSGGAGAVKVIYFEEKLQLYSRGHQTSIFLSFFNHSLRYQQI